MPYLYIMKALPILFLALLLTACTKRIYVPQVETRTEYVTQRDTLHTHDTLMRIDSVITLIKGDTVTIERWKFRDRISTQYKVRTDTLCRTDSIPYMVEVEKKVEVEKQLTSWQKARLGAGDTLIALLVAAALWGGWRLWRKLK